MNNYSQRDITFGSQLCNYIPSSYLLLSEHKRLSNILETSFVRYGCRNDLRIDVPDKPLKSVLYSCHLLTIFSVCSYK